MKSYTPERNKSYEAKRYEREAIPDFEVKKERQFLEVLLERGGESPENAVLYGGGTSTFDHARVARVVYDMVPMEKENPFWEQHSDLLDKIKSGSERDQQAIQEKHQAAVAAVEHEVRERSGSGIDYSAPYAQVAKHITMLPFKADYAATTVGRAHELEANAASAARGLQSTSPMAKNYAEFTIEHSAFEVMSRKNGSDTLLAQGYGDIFKQSGDGIERAENRARMYESEAHWADKEKAVLDAVLEGRMQDVLTDSSRNGADSQIGLDLPDISGILQNAINANNQGTDHSAELMRFRHRHFFDRLTNGKDQQHDAIFGQRLEESLGALERVRTLQADLEAYPYEIDNEIQRVSPEPHGLAAQDVLERKVLEAVRDNNSQALIQSLTAYGSSEEQRQRLEDAQKVLWNVTGAANGGGTAGASELLNRHETFFNTLTQEQRGQLQANTTRTFNQVHDMEERKASNALLDSTKSTGWEQVGHGVWEIRQEELVIATATQHNVADPASKNDGFVVKIMAGENSGKTFTSSSVGDAYEMAVEAVYDALPEADRLMHEQNKQEALAQEKASGFSFGGAVRRLFGGSDREQPSESDNQKPTSSSTMRMG